MAPINKYRQSRVITRHGVTYDVAELFSALATGAVKDVKDFVLKKKQNGK